MQGFIRIILAAVILGTQLVASPPAMASCSSGSVSGTNTVDIENFTGSFAAGTYVLGVKATGTGTNTLTIKVEVPGTLGWKEIASGTIDLGDTNGCGYREVQFTLATSSDVRYRFSRKIGTAAIDYEWDHDYLVLWSPPSCLTC